MDEKTQELKSEFEIAVKRNDSLIADIRTLEEHLAERKQALEAAILEGKDSTKIESEISNLQIKISATKNVQITIAGQVDGLSAKLASKKRSLALTNSYFAKDEADICAKKVYGALEATLNEIKELQRKTSAYYKLVKEADAMQGSRHNARISSYVSLGNKLEAEIKTLLNNIESFRTE